MSTIEIESTPAVKIRNVIGQTAAVEYLERESRNIAAGSPLPFFALYDAPGLGKTHLVQQFGKTLPRDVNFVSLNCKDALNITGSVAKDYFAALSEALGEGVRTIVHLDEFANQTGTGSLQKWIASHLSKAADGTALAIHGGDPLPFNPLSLGFIVTSFCPARAAIDLKDRLKQPKQLELTNYSAPELMEILTLAIRRECRLASLASPRINDPALLLVAKSMRGNARQANDVAAEVRKMIIDSPDFSLTIKTAESIMRTVGVLPHGLTADEAKILSCLSVSAKNRDTLRQKTGVSKDHWIKAINYLQEGTGRGEPFQLMDAKTGNPIEGASGALVDYEKGHYHLTRHGLTIVKILKDKNWLS